MPSEAELIEMESRCRVLAKDLDTACALAEEMLPKKLSQQWLRRLEDIESIADVVCRDLQGLIDQARKKGKVEPVKVRAAS